MKITIEVDQPLVKHFFYACKSCHQNPEDLLLMYIESFTRDQLGEMADEFLGPKEVKDPIMRDSDYEKDK